MRLHNRSPSARPVGVDLKTSRREIKHRLEGGIFRINALHEEGKCCLEFEPEIEM